MNIHFLYRYWNNSRPKLIALFARTPFIIFLIAISLSVFVVWYLLCVHGLSGQVHDDAVERLRAEFERRFGTNKTAWMVMDWNNESEAPGLFVLMLVFDSIIIVSFLTAATLGTLTFFGVRRAWKISQSKCHVQAKLLIAVTAQTSVPVVCVYIPFFCCITLPYLGFSASTVADLCFFMTACFPPWDAVIIIVLMSDYRHAIWSLMRRKKTAPKLAASQMSAMQTSV
ncbi:hypothetical protein PMAYCL1PPCAC_15054, partial [Pristionchus mayeri]